MHFSEYDTRLAAYAVLVDNAFLAGTPDKAEFAAREFQDRVRVCLEKLLANFSDRDRGRLSIELGSSRAVEDVKTLHGILSARDSLTMLGTLLPGHIAVFGGPILDTLQLQLDAALGGRKDFMIYALLVLMGRIAADLITGVPISYDLSRFRLSRFA